jgi:methionine--tRNA ligase beta chain
MSKSLGNIISIFENEDVIKKQVMSAYTDPTRGHATDPGHIEGNMVFTYLEFFGDPPDGGAKVDKLKEQYKKGQISDIEVKNYLFESLMKTFQKSRERYEDLKNHPEKVKKILEDGAVKAKLVAGVTMNEVRETIGFKNQYSIGTSSTISIDDFARVEMRVGKVIEAKNKEGSEKLIRLVVDFGEKGTRVIFTGVRGYGYTPEDFFGKQFMFVFNLAPRKMMDEESHGMILAVGDDKPLFLSAEGLPVGTKIR